MIIAIDGSSPAITSGIGTSFTTSAFNPPDNSLLVATFMGSSSATISNNGTALTWTQRATNTNNCIYTAPLATGRTGMTVTAGIGTSSSRGFKVDVITGADLSTPVGATGTGSSATQNVNVNGYTSTLAGSRGLCSVFESNGLGLPSSSDDEAAWSSVFDGMRVAKASNTATVGSTVTFNLVAPSSGPSWSWLAVEIMPAPDPPRPAVYVRNIAAVHRAANF